MTAAVADKLDEARALIERGWCQGVSMRLVGRKTNYCALGAICQAVNGWPCDNAGDVPTVRNAFLKANRLYGVARWNDAPERTQAEVIDAFKRAADLARGEA